VRRLRLTLDSGEVFVTPPGYVLTDVPSQVPHGFPVKIAAGVSDLSAVELAGDDVKRLKVTIDSGESFTLPAGYLFHIQHAEPIGVTMSVGTFTTFSTSQLVAAELVDDAQGQPK